MRMGGARTSNLGAREGGARNRDVVRGAGCKRQGGALQLGTRAVVLGLQQGAFVRVASCYIVLGIGQSRYPASP